MAKQPPKADQNGKMKVRIIEFELEGSDMSLQESLKSITAALSRPSNGASVTRVSRIEALKQSNASSMPSVDDGDTVEEAEYVEEVDTQPAPAPAAKRPRKLSRAPTPTLLRDVRFDDVSPTFAEFIEEKQPKGDRSKYLCVAYWLKSYKEIQEISIDHVYTAYRVMSWALPAAAIQPMRELAANRDGRFSKGHEQGHYAINHVGEGFVTTKMGSGQ
jgi:hypothetical protein